MHRPDSWLAALATVGSGLLLTSSIDAAAAMSAAPAAGSAREPAAASTARVHPSPALRITFRNGLLSVVVTGQPLREVMHEVSRVTGIAHRLAIDGETRISVSFADLPVAQALQRLAGADAALVLVYAAADTKAAGPAPADAPVEVWVLPAGGHGAAPVDTGGRGRETPAPATTEARGRDADSDVMSADAAGEARTAPRLLAATQDARPQVRLAAVESLGEMGDESAVDTLDGLMRRDAVADVRASAAAALAKIGSSRALLVLREAFTSADVAVRRSAIAAIAQSGADQSLDLVRAALKDRDEEVRRVAAEALGELEGRAR